MPGSYVLMATSSLDGSTTPIPAMLAEVFDEGGAAKGWRADSDGRPSTDVNANPRAKIPNKGSKNGRIFFM